MVFSVTPVITTKKIISGHYIITHRYRYLGTIYNTLICYYLFVCIMLPKDIQNNMKTTFCIVMKCFRVIGYTYPITLFVFSNLCIRFLKTNFKSMNSVFKLI